MKNIIDLDFQYNEGGELEILEDTINPINYPDRDDESAGWRLDITAKINNDGDFEVYDTTSYEMWDADGMFGINDPNGILNDDPNVDDQGNVIPKWKYLVIQRLVLLNDENNKLVGWNFETDADTIAKLRSPWIKEVPGNGLYHYRKLLIPYKENISSVLEKLYYDDSENIMYYESDGTPRSVPGPKIVITDVDGRITDLIDLSATNYDNFDKIFDSVVEKQYNGCFYYSSDTFSAYDLVKCYVIKAQKKLENQIKNNCSGNCSNTDSKLNTEVDILLSAIMTIDYLLTKGDYFEAQRILNSLDTCGGLCKDVKDNLKGCDCGTN